MTKQAKGPVSRALWILIALLVTHILLLTYSATQHSPTALEPALLTAGISHWEYGQFGLYNVNPPLVRMVAALPVLAAGYQTDWTELHYSSGPRPEYALGKDFIAVNGQRSAWLITIARWACIPFSIIGAVVSFLWATELYRSKSAGLLAAALWCFDPNVLAHGELITNDCAAAALGLAAAYTFWKWLNSTKWMAATAAGAALGIAILAKTTWLILYGVWPVIGMFWYFRRQNGSSAKAYFAQLIFILAVSLYPINMLYVFAGTFTRLGDFHFVSNTFGSTNYIAKGTSPRSWLANLPVPLPREFVLGVDMQISDLERFDSPSYLAGQWNDHGWWYYYLYGMFVKFPHGTQDLLLFVLSSRMWRPRLKRHWNELVLVIPALCVFLLVSANTTFDHHFRYVLPCFGFGFVFLGQAITLFRRRGRFVVLALLACSMASALTRYPHLLAYFNEAAGGPLDGHKHLLHSSLDWGQDLLNLQRWVSRHPEAHPLTVAYSGGFEARSFGMNYDRPPQRDVGLSGAPNYDIPLMPGWYALSVNYIFGKAPEYHYFQRLKPVTTAGYSIYIYHLSAEEVIQLNQELRP